MKAAAAIAAVIRVCRRVGVPPTRFLVVVGIQDQTVRIFERQQISHACNADWKSALRTAAGTFVCLKKLRCSTSKFGVGEQAGSYKTPRGLHRIAAKIGGGWPVGTVFKGRRAIGYTWQGLPGAAITTRILWLEGLEPGLNRGGRVDSHSRYIYLHGTGDEPSLGRPASHGCVQLSSSDLVPLYERLPEGTLVWITTG